MSVTQVYKNVQFSPDEISNIYESLFEREETLLREIEGNKAVEWEESVAKGERDLAVVRNLIKRLEAL